jgi:thiamine transport system ATP-binding protein
MRAGRIVQQGEISEVWRNPADPATALFLGYAAVLDGPAAATVLAAAGLPAGPAVALRRSALVAGVDGPLTGRVVSSRLTPEQVRLRVDVPGLGELDAVAPLDAHPGPGEEVALRVDRTRLAAMSGR